MVVLNQHAFGNGIVHLGIRTLLLWKACSLLNDIKSTDFDLQKVFEAAIAGINSQILSPSGGNIGIGFAIPANMARDVLDRLIKNGKVRRGHLGIIVQPATDDIASSLGLSSPRGVIVSQIKRGSPAERGLSRAT